MSPCTPLEVLAPSYIVLSVSSFKWHTCFCFPSFPSKQGSLHLMSGRKRPGKSDGINRKEFKRASDSHAISRGLHKGQEILSTQVTFLEALPNLFKLLRLLWSLSPRRTLVMSLGNFTKSLLPAYDLSIRARLIEVLNVAIRDKSPLENHKVLRLLVLQLVSLVSRNVLEVALSDNQQLLNSTMSRALKQQLLKAHLTLDAAALEDSKNVAILADAVSMTEPGYLGSLTSIVFNLTNSFTDITARIAATSRIISMDALPYFILYSLVPIAMKTYGRFRNREWAVTVGQDAFQRRTDLAAIAFDPKVKSLKNLPGLKELISVVQTGGPSVQLAGIPDRGV